jgi:PAS domain S-box-containing protein
MAEVRARGNEAHAGSASAEAPRYRMLDRVCPVGIFRADATGRFRDVNARWCEMTGLEPNAALDDGWFAAIHDDDRDRVRQLWDLAVENRTELRIEFGLEPRGPRDDPRWVLAEAVPCSAEENEESSILGTFTDVTELKRDQAVQKGQTRILQLIAAGAELDKVLTVIALLIEEICPDTMCSVLFLNDRQTHLRYGIAPSLPVDYVEATNHVAIGPKFGSCGAAAATGARVVVEDIETDEHWEESREVAIEHGLRACWSQPLLSSTGKVVGTFAMYYCDRRRPTAAEIRLLELAAYLAEIAITHSRAESQMHAEKQAALASNRRKTGFLARVSHDMRTPMNTIMGVLELALATELNDEQREYVTTARRSATSILGLLNDVIDLARIESGKMKLEAREFAVRDFLSDTLAGLAYSAHKKGIELCLDVDVNVPAHCVGDPARVRQVLVNLASNGIKFTDSGEVTVRVETEWCGNDEISLKVTVRDTGIGIPKTLHGHIFDSFVQADDAAGHSCGGSGLGLAISARLVRMMGGRIWVASEVGEGTSFFFTVRLGTSSTKALTPPPSLRGVRALIAVDNATLRGSLTTTLNRWGLETQSLGSSAEVIDALEREASYPCDILFVDPSASTMDDLTVRVAHLCAKGPAVVLLESTHHRSDTIAMKSVARVAKPPRESALREAIVSALAGEGTTKAVARSTTKTTDDSRRALFEVDLARSLRILLVDDNDDNRTVATRVLTKRGHEVVIARNGQEALDYLESNEVDVALMDLHMPVMDGLEATVEIRKREKNSGEHLPIIAITANALKAGKEQCLVSGMDAYLAKPFGFQELFDIVEGLGPK